MIEPLQDVLKKVNLKHAGIKQEPYSTPLQDQLQQLQHHKINMLFLLDSNPVALQQQLFTAIRQLHQAKAPNSYPNTPGANRSIKPTDGQIICCRCHQVGHYTCSCRATLMPGTTKTDFFHAQPHTGGCQNQRPSFLNHGTLQYLESLYVPKENNWHTNFRLPQEQFFGIQLPTGLHMYLCSTRTHFLI